MTAWRVCTLCTLKFTIMLEISVLIKQIKSMLKSEKLERTITNVEREALFPIRDVVRGFLGNTKDPNCKQVVAKLTKSFKEFGFHVPKGTFLAFRLRFLPGKLRRRQRRTWREISSEYLSNGKKIPRTVETTMMGDYIWSLLRRNKNLHSRKLIVKALLNSR